MKFPFKFIESKYTDRNEFRITDGHQPTHAIFYLKKGSFEIEIEGKKETVSVGDCYILPDYVYYRRKVLEPIEFVYIKFATEPTCPYAMEIPFGKAAFRDKVRFVSNITALEKLLSKEDSVSAAYREHLLLDILFQIYFERSPEKIPGEASTSHDALVLAAIAYIEKNLTEKILIGDLCRSIGTNASTLNFKFRREFNLSVGQYITKLRIKKAQKLLTGTSYSISEIAARTGFGDVYYFSNTFKKVLGVSPSGYRK